MNILRLTIASLFLFGGVAQGATLACEVPAANVARSVQLCEELRQQLRVRSSEWDTNICATEFLRLGLVEGERRVSTRAAKATVAGDVNDAVVDFQSTWPHPTRAVCGDGTLDSEDPFNEECDDGNTVGGDGCDSSCIIEP